MLRRIITALVLLPLVLLLVFHAPQWLFLLTVDVFIILSVWELSRILAQWGSRTYSLTYLAAGLLPWIWVYSKAWAPQFLVAVVFLILGWTVICSKRVEEGLPSATGNLLGVTYLGLPFAVLAELRFRPGLEISPGSSEVDLAACELLFLLGVLWCSDGGAYFTGKLWGRHRIVTMISPKKTLEGYVGGLFAGIVTALLAGPYLLSSSSLSWLLLTGVVLVSAGGLGDLFESLLKRGAGVKDSSSLIPGHGGVLDRIDSLLFALPAYYLWSEWSRIF
jgi:phosphatidate cytidylyltransferase